MTFGTDSLAFMAMLLLCEAIHLWQSPRRQRFILRISLGTAVCLALSLAVPGFSGELTWCNALSRFGSFSLSVGMVFFCWEDTLFHVVNKCVFGWLTYCCAYTWAVVAADVLGGQDNFRWVFWVVFPLTYGLFAFFSWYNARRRRSSGSAANNTRWRTVLIEVVSIAVFSTAGALSWGEHSTAAAISILLTVYLCHMLLGVYSDERRLADEYAILRQMQEKERAQYETSKEYMELLNIKSHDMKHLLTRLRQEGAAGDVAQELEKTLADFDTVAKTGSEPLDLVLTEKARLCAQKGIRLSFIADGQKIAFLQPADIYSLIGNILDNAIEATEQVPEQERRVITLYIREEAGLVHVRTENCCREQVEIAGDLPVTTKSDKQNHGFGTKSIRLTAEKYHGFVHFSCTDCFFVTDVLFPTLEYI